MLGQLEQDARQREPGQERRGLRVQQRRRGHVHRHVPVDPVQQPGGALQGHQLQPVAATDAVRLGEDRVRGLAPLLREPAQRLGADPTPGDDVDDGLQQHPGAAGELERVEPAVDVLPTGLLADLGLDDHRRGPRQHVHQALVPVAEALVGAQPGGAERAVQGAVAQHHGHRHVAADTGEARRGQPHGFRVGAQVGDHRGEVAVQDGLAQAGRLPLRGALREQQRHRGLHHLQVLGGAVQAGQERDAQVQRLLGGPQQVGDLLVHGAALPAHLLCIGRRGCTPEAALAWRPCCPPRSPSAPARASSPT